MPSKCTKSSEKLQLLQSISSRVERMEALDQAATALRSHLTRVVAVSSGPVVSARTSQTSSGSLSVEQGI